ncbi:hypothetical protein EA26_02025 [Vibrio navarrensis]|uniref:Uncharacterized protein n=1 Tax=Vibrio navarrensis TaxID=29495 RepID=A0A099LR69_9VIBR|nr:hypothetical protein [Vibrio navarrensis]KGK10154.1 hypothetical protein EA26_02025 [Vibrio navarrensis]MBE4616489.1 hypothetical protein [Vibrio navarrensis]
MINNIYGGLLSILWRTAQIVFWGEERKRRFWVLGPWFWESKGGREGPMVLWSCGPVVLWSCGPVGKAKSVTRESKALGSRKARAEEREKKVLGSGPWVLGRAKAGKAGNEFSRS